MYKQGWGSENSKANVIKMSRPKIFMKAGTERKPSDEFSLCVVIFCVWGWRSRWSCYQFAYLLGKKANNTGVRAAFLTTWHTCKSLALGLWLWMPLVGPTSFPTLQNAPNLSARTHPISSNRTPDLFVQEPVEVVLEGSPLMILQITQN